VQTSNPAQFNTATFGTPGARSASGEPEAASDEAEEKGEVDLFKVRRVTIPPEMRTKMIDWWAHERQKSVPADTVPPNQVTAGVAAKSAAPKRDNEPSIVVNKGVESDTIPDLKHARPAVPDSVTPVGVPKVPMRSVRGIAVGIVFLLAMFLLLAVALQRSKPVMPPSVAASNAAASPVRTSDTSTSGVLGTSAVSGPTSSSERPREVTQPPAPSTTRPESFAPAARGVPNAGTVGESTAPGSPNKVSARVRTPHPLDAPHQRPETPPVPKSEDSDIDTPFARPLK
jgi:hypothetical protein